MLTKQAHNAPASLGAFGAHYGLKLEFHPRGAERLLAWGERRSSLRSGYARLAIRFLKWPKTTTLAENHR